MLCARTEPLRGDYSCHLIYSLRIHHMPLGALVVTFKVQDHCKHLVVPMGPVCRAALGKCLWAHLCKHAHLWGGSAKGWLTPNAPAPSLLPPTRPLILQSCQQKCKAIPTFPNKLNPAGGVLASRDSKHLSSPHFKNTHALILGGMQPLNYFSGLNLRRLGS